jgi:hypothetical protein
LKNDNVFTVNSLSVACRNTAIVRFTVNTICTLYVEMRFLKVPMALLIFICDPEQRIANAVHGNERFADPGPDGLRKATGNPINSSLFII